MIVTRYVIQDQSTGLYYSGTYGGMRRYTDNPWFCWHRRTQEHAEWEMRYTSRYGRVPHIVVKIEREV